MIHAKEDTTFVEDGGLGRVDVFSFAGRIILGCLRELACGKGDNAALHVADGDHEATTKAGLEIFVISFAISGEKEARLVHRGGG